jgi:hypothetical protein
MTTIDERIENMRVVISHINRKDICCIHCISEDKVPCYMCAEIEGDNAISSNS